MTSHFDDTVLLRYLREELRPEEQSAVDTHLEVCADRRCAAALERLARSAALSLPLFLRTTPEVSAAAEEPLPELPARYEPLGLVGHGGMGLVVVPSFMVAADLRAGRLVEVLTAFSFVRLTVSAVYAPARVVPSNVRAFVDHLVAFFRVPPWPIEGRPAKEGPGKHASSKPPGKPPPGKPSAPPAERASRRPAAR